MPILLISSSFRSLFLSLLQYFKTKRHRTHDSPHWTKKTLPKEIKSITDSFMAVEAQHTNLLATKPLLDNSQTVKLTQANTNLYNSQMGYELPLSGSTAESFLPMYNSAKIMMESDSSVLYDIPNASRKRNRDSFNPFMQNVLQKNPNFNLSFLGEDLSCFVQHQRFDLDRLISEQMERLRMEIQETIRKQASKLVQVIEISTIKSLKAKQQELDNIRKLNYALQERFKALCMENQIWKELAQNNEATANALRTNIEQVLMAQAQGNITATTELDDAVSSCGSVDESGDIKRDQEEAKGSGCALDYKKKSWCKNCWEKESCVLLLPCRHLCLCTTCGSNLHVCPICNSVKNGSVHVNFS